MGSGGRRGAAGARALPLLLLLLPAPGAAALPLPGECRHLAGSGAARGAVGGARAGR